MNYPMIIHKDPGSGFGASFPDLLGCTAVGDTVTEALKLAQEAAYLWIEYALNDGEPLPKPTKIDEYVERDEPEYNGLFWSYVTIDPDKLTSTTKRINITVPENMLSAFDAYAQAHNMSRSALMTSATMERIMARVNE